MSDPQQMRASVPVIDDAVETDEELVLVIALHGDDYEAAVDAINDLGGSTGAAVEHLARWDTGDEIDRATTVLGTTPRHHVERQPHHVEEHDNLTYWLVADHQLGLYALYRRPLAVAE